MFSKIVSDNHDWVGPFTIAELNYYLVDNGLDINQAIVWFLNAPGCSWITPHHCHAILFRGHLLQNHDYKKYKEEVDKNGGLYLLLDDIGLHELTPVLRNSISAPESVTKESQVLKNKVDKPEEPKTEKNFFLYAGLLIALLMIICLFMFINSKPLYSSQSTHLVPIDTIELRKFARKILEGNEQAGWKGELLTKSELIKGNRGKYFEINISQINTKEVILFEPGFYTIDDFNEKFKSSINHFGMDVLKYVEENEYEYEIFVKGSADLLGDETFRDTIF